MSKRQSILPESSLINGHAFSDENFLFHDEAVETKNIVETMMDAFRKDKDRCVGIDNIIGVFGGRGSGKTTLCTSVIKSIQEENGSLCSIKCIEGPIDPKTLPNSIGIVGLVLGKLYAQFLSTFKEKKTDDSVSSSIMELFDQINTLVARLLEKQQRDTIENPSDLYEISQITTIRAKLEGLVEKLAAYCEIADGAFLISIDDFDLDASNCYRMAIDIITFLNIPHLIFLLAMDEAIFRKELLRARVAELSDFGQATRAILAEAPALGVNVLSDVYNDALKYATQLGDKFIPLSKRVNMRSGHYLDDQSQEIAAKIYSWIFGLQGKPFDYTPSVNELFMRALSSCEDLRTRNQSLNQMVSIMDNAQGKYAQGFEYRLLNNLDFVCKRLSETINIGWARESSADRNPGSPYNYTSPRTFFQAMSFQLGLLAQSYETYGYLCPWKMLPGSNDIIVSAEQRTVRFSDIAKQYLSEHCLGYFVYEYYVRRLNPLDENFIFNLAGLLDIFAPGVAFCDSDALSGERRLTIANFSYSESDVRRTFQRPDAQHLLNEISAFESHAGRITRGQLENILTLMKEYFDTRGSMPSMVKNLSQALVKIVHGNWGNADERSNRKAEALTILRRIARYIKLNG